MGYAEGKRAALGASAQHPLEKAPLFGGQPPPTPEGAPACGIVGKGFPLGLQAVEALITHMSRPRSSSPYTEFKVM